MTKRIIGFQVGLYEKRGCAAGLNLKGKEGNLIIV
jgi:hypothetical protein